MSEKVAVVTAAGRGIGAAIARELAATGYRLGLLSPSGAAETLADELGGVGVTGSVRDPDDLSRLVEVTMGTYGRIDAVVNNTGHPPKGGLLDIADEDWHLGVDLAFLNVVRMARLVTPIMERQGGGAFVNVSAFGAVEPDLAFPVSSAVRAALRAFTKLFADRYGPVGIRMNDLVIGFVESYPVDEDRLATIPIGRPATLREVAATARFLLSDEAGAITGEGVRVDGGMLRSL